jgi:hypothetical protein
MTFDTVAKEKVTGAAAAEDDPPRFSANITVYPGEDEMTGLDAIVSMPGAMAMLKIVAAAKRPLGRLYVCQPVEKGPVAFDVQVSASVAAKVLANAEQSGVLVHRLMC